MMRMTMKMAAFSGVPLLLLLCSVISSTESQPNCDRYAARGEAFAVPLGHQLKVTERVKWRRGSFVIVERRPPSTGAEGHVFSTGTKDDIFPNGSLTLRNVKPADAGEYTPTVHTGDGKSAATLDSVHVCVLDRVPQPTVNTTCLPKSKVKLTCDVGKVEGLTFVWLQNDKEQKNPKSPVWILDLKDVKDSFSCRVSNALGPKTSTTVTGLCPQSIIPEHMWELIWICVGSGGGLVLLLIIIVIVCCVRAKRKKRSQKIDEEELRLRWANPEQQQHHQCPQHGHPTSRRHQHQHQGQHQGQRQGQRQGQDQDQDQHKHQQQQQQPAGHTGPRQHRSKQQRPRAPEPPLNHPQPSTMRPAQNARADVNGDEEQAPPLPKPRSKTPRTRV